MYGLAGVVGFEGLLEDDKSTLQVFNLEHIGHAHFLVAVNDIASLDCRHDRNDQKLSLLMTLKSELG